MCCGEVGCRLAAKRFAACAATRTDPPRAADPPFVIFALLASGILLPLEVVGFPIESFCFCGQDGVEEHCREL